MRRRRWGDAGEPCRTVGVLAVTTRVDEAVESVEVSGAFRDPDDDALTYGATSSSPGVVSVSVSGSAVTVTPLSEGTSTVTVTATDTGGSDTSATQTFTVTVGAPANRPPEPVGVLAPLTMRVDEAAETVEVSGAFRDPDGDDLTYRRRSSAPTGGVGVGVGECGDGDAVVGGNVDGDGDGDRRSGGSNTTATQTFTVTVRARPANRPPEPVGTYADAAACEGRRGRGDGGDLGCVP